jgi:RNA 2',3'-cyclic 3'-phosphodiesterase
VPLSELARDQVAELVDRVRARAPGSRPGSPPNERAVRWVRLDGLHVTLRFLGPTLPERFPDIEAAVERTASGATSFGVRIAGAGAFPRPDQPRTLWLGLTDGATELARLARSLDEALVGAGWPPDPRAGRAHLTLARSDGLRGGPETVRLLVEEVAGWHVDWTADRLVLFESVTGGGPARYEPLLEVPLAGGASLQQPAPDD